MLSAGSIDLSHTLNLKELIFRLHDLENVVPAFALVSLTSEHRYLHRVSLYIPGHRTMTLAQMRPETHSQWLGLDHVLVQLWESNGVHVQVVCAIKEGEDVCKCIKWLLPEVVKTCLQKFSGSGVLA